MGKVERVGRQLDEPRAMLAHGTAGSDARAPEKQQPRREFESSRASKLLIFNIVFIPFDSLNSVVGAKCGCPAVPSLSSASSFRVDSARLVPSGQPDSFPAASGTAFTARHLPAAALSLCLPLSSFSLFPSHIPCSCLSAAVGASCCFLWAFDFPLWRLPLATPLGGCRCHASSSARPRRRGFHQR